MLFNDIVFGPIHSRRLGTSLGINLLPSQHKLCNFNCVYCECGFNTVAYNKKCTLPTIHDVVSSLEKFASAHHKDTLRTINSITFSGNGEPTLHPDFAEICRIIYVFRTGYMPQANITLLSNATTIGKLPTQNALKYIDNVILKLDCGTPTQYKLINRASTQSFERLIENMTRFGRERIIQTLLVKSTDPQSGIDNTEQSEFSAYLKIVKAINPKSVMLYSIDRQTPDSTLIKIPTDKLEEYADQLRYLGIKTEVY
ncbi:MAG: radical SAM protein [Bacteroidales bacterium]|nr:radical SAM protein [Bacteroidales bacterium]